MVTVLSKGGNLHKSPSTNRTIGLLRHVVRDNRVSKKCVRVEMK